MRRAGLAVWGFWLLCSPAWAQEVPREPVLRLEAGGPTSYVTAVAFSPDGKTLYAGGWDKLVRVWRLDEKSGKFQPAARASFRVPIGPGLQGAINTLTVSPDGEWLAVSGKGVIREAAGFRAPGRILPTVGGMTDRMRLDEGTIYVFNTRTYKTYTLRGHYGAVLALAFAPGEKNAPVLVSAGHEWYSKDNKMIGTVRAWDVLGRQHPNAYIGGRILAEPQTRPELVVRRRGRKLSAIEVAFAWGDGSLRVWDAAANRLRTIASGGQFDNTLAGSANRLYAGSFAAGGGRIQSWNWTAGGLEQAQGRAQFPSQGNTHFVPRAVELLRNGQGNATHAATIVLSVQNNAGQNFQLKLLDLNAARFGQVVAEADLWKPGTTLALPALAASPDGQYVAVAGSSAHDIAVYAAADLLRGRAAPQRLQSIGATASTVAFVRGGNASGLLLREVGKPEPGAVPAVLRGGETIFSLPTGQLLSHQAGDGWQLNLADAGPWQVQANRRQAAGEAVRWTLQVTRGGQNASEIVLPAGHELSDFAIRHHANRPLIAVSSHDRGQPRLQLFNATSGQAVRELSGHTLPIRSLAFSGDGRFLVSASDDQTVSVWSLKDLDAIWGQRGLLPGVAVQAANAGGLEIARVDDDSPLAELLAAGHRVEGMVVANNFQRLANPAAFYDAFWYLKPGDRVTLRLAGPRNVPVVVHQGIDERKPLFSLFVTRDQLGGARQWIGWSPLGPFETSNPVIEQHVGWHFNTGDLEAPTVFAPIGEYREAYFRKGLLRELLRTGELTQVERAPLERPTMDLILPEMLAGAERVADRVLIRKPPAALDLSVFGASSDDIAGIELLVDGDKTGAFQLQPDQSWQADLSQLQWQRGPHRLTAVITTAEEPPQAFSEELLVQFQPPAPRIELGMAPRLTVQKPEFDLAADVTPAAANMARIQLRHVHEGKEVEAPSWNAEEPMKVKRKLTLKPGENIIDLKAVNAEALQGHQQQETESRRIVVYYEQEPAPAADIELSHVTAGDVRKRSESLPIDASRPLVVDRPEIHLHGKIAAEEPLAVSELRKEGAAEARRVTGFQPMLKKSVALNEKLALEPGVQTYHVYAKTATGGMRRAEVKIEFRPPLPDAVLLSPSDGTVFQQGRDPQEVTLKAQLRWPPHAGVATAAILVNNRTVGEETTLQPGTQTLTSKVRLSPGENSLRLKLSNQWGRVSLCEPATVHFRQPPRIVRVKKPQVGDVPVVAVAVDVQSQAPLKRVEVAGRPVPAEAIRFDKTQKQWNIVAEHIPLTPGKNVLKVEAWNEDGKSVNAGEVVVDFDQPLGELPVVEFVSPASDLKVVRAAQDVKFRVRSRGRPQAVTLFHNGQMVYRVPGLEELKPTADGIFELEAEAKVHLQPQVNYLEAVAVGETGEGSAKLKATYLHMPVRLVLDRLEPLSAPDAAIEPQADELTELKVARPVPDGRILLHGRVLWNEDDPTLRGRQQRIQVWVNGFQQLPAALEPVREPARQRAFKASVVLNKDRNNRIEFALPKLPRASRGLLQVEVDCEKPVTEQRLHLVVVGVGVAENRVVELEDRVLHALQADRAEGSAKQFATPSFTTGRIYGPLSGNMLTKEHIVTQLMRVNRSIAGLMKARPAGDVVMIYYQGGQLIADEERFFLTTRASEYETPASDPSLRLQAVDSQLLARFLAATQGAHLLLLDVERNAPPEQRNLLADAMWPPKSRSAMLRYTWRKQAPPTDDSRMISIFNRAVRQAPHLEEVEEELERGVAQINQQFPDVVLYDRHLPPSLLGLRLGAP